ncbi:hypothetical protein [Acidovorax sp. CCYZU-2555]|uniref:hypothetical protein n=1 Tax=Acidovorax sp. CCYZU-2555 TaxID=2835042 RepID=UPI001BCCC8C1|nr:hypothetical protein [Acidovorax sp. CCYZU-2555]MBS7777661.1 hypothetical protein [Acidovorax sp. CCYZU-2555]
MFELERSMKFIPWILALLITLGMGHFAARANAEADQEDAAALSSREFAGQVLCGKNAVAVWTDDKSMDCFKELP